MAIVVEEEKQSKGSFIGVLIWIVILSVLGAIVYYIFFKKPQTIEVLQPVGFKNTEALSKINLNTEELVQSPAFQALKSYIPLPKPINAGRTNPFLGF